MNGNIKTNNRKQKSLQNDLVNIGYVNLITTDIVIVIVGGNVVNTSIINIVTMTKI